MKGQGRTVMRGTKIENFDVEVLGVLKNTSPGRDLVLCRLSGLNLENTGVIAGMSGSPVYIDNKLLGAVAYAWAFGKEPIAGVTPFSQMHGYVAAYERRDRAEQGGPPARVGLNRPVTVGGRDFDTVTVAQGFDDPRPDAADGLWLVPLRTVGVINADVSTCIAGWLDRQPDMLPVRMTVRREPGNQSKTFNVEVVRQRAMLATLVYTVLTNSVDMEGELPEELTAELKARIE